MRIFARLAFTAVLGGSVASFVGNASAYTTFFGQDPNNSATVPLSQTPNSDAAQQAFLSNLETPRVEDFESQTVGAKAPLKLLFPGAGGTDLQATLVGTSGEVAEVTPGTTNGFGRYSVPSATTSRFWNVVAGPEGNFTVEFDQKVPAFGFYGIDVGDFLGSLQLELMNGSVQVGLLNVPHSTSANDGSVLFFGLIAQSEAELFTSVRFLTTTGNGDAFAFDNFTVGDLKRVTPVPEPGSLALVAFGLAALSLAGRRQRRR